jgi:hypothetical protein
MARDERSRGLAAMAYGAQPVETAGVQSHR